MIFLNISNHHSSLWSDDQVLTALKYGEIIDIPFPNIDPRWGKEEIERLSLDYLGQINSLTETFDNSHVTIHIMGEMVFTFLLVSKLLIKGYRVVASTTERKVTYNKKQIKEVYFEFVCFREYIKG